MVAPLDQHSFFDGFRYLRVCGIHDGLSIFEGAIDLKFEVVTTVITCADLAGDIDGFCDWPEQ
ncbi:hypothetical protein [Thiorhodovibrio litoralis]|uniref:hypothetical protein n=1 Tax=Thiorhodovibrio litoralis TaxID=2952932 RepID=UPI002B2611E6|nr:hypothetical protein [Thiorhodovibrio litoralis]